MFLNSDDFRVNSLNKWLLFPLLQSPNLDPGEDAPALTPDQPLRVGHQTPVELLEEVEQVAGQDKHVGLHRHLEEEEEIIK